MNVFKHAIVLCTLLMAPFIMFASHFRYANISWQNTSGNTVVFKISEAWRGNYFGAFPSLGAVIPLSGTEATFYFGDGSNAPVSLTVTSVNPLENWFYGEYTVTHTYATAGNFIAYYASCCRISTLTNNPDGNFNVQAKVNVGAGNSSPVSSLVPIVDVPANTAAALFNIPASDPNGSALGFRFSTSTEAGPGFIQPAGLSINGTTGQMTFNTVGKLVGQLYCTQIMISDGVAEIPLDFIIRISGGTGTPPFFDHPTPHNGEVFNIIPGQNLTFPVVAADDDAGSTVVVSSAGAPLGSTFTPALPVSGNPATTGFSWTPTVANLGTYVINFNAQDNTGKTANTSVTINVTPGATCTLALNADVTNVTCLGGNNGAIDLTPTGGVGTLTYLWSNGATTEDLTGITAGQYEVTVTDANSCSKTLRLHVETDPDNTDPIITCPPTTKYCVTATGNYTIPALTASDNCGLASVTFAISGATTRNSTGNDASGAFNVGTSTIEWTATDGSGNTSTCSTTVVINPLPVAGINSNSPNSFCNKLTLSATATLTGPFTYAWVFDNAPYASTRDIQLDNTNANGDYSVLVTDGNGCQSATAAVFNYVKENVVSNYTIIGLKGSALDVNNQVLSGSIGVMEINGKAKFDVNCSVAATGAFVKASSIIVNDPVNIPNRINAPATITLPVMLHNSASTLGLPIASVDKDAVVTLTGNYRQLTIKEGAVVTLSGTIFGTIIVKQNAKVIFTEPVINIEKLMVGKGADGAYTTISFTGDANVLIREKVKLDENVRINEEAHKVTFYVDAMPTDEEKFMMKANDIRVIANIYIPSGNLRITPATTPNTGGFSDNSATTYMTGLFIAEEVTGLGRNIVWNNYECTNAGVQNARQITTLRNNLPDAVIPELTITANNPASTFFRLVVTGKANQPINVRLVDVMGRVMESRNGVQSGSVFTMGSRLGNGVYFAEVIQGNERKVLKLMKVN